MNFNLLRGLRVVESSAFIAAPLAGMTLAQYGADVIRVDMIGGGIDYARLPMMPKGRSLYWTGLNKGKRSIAIDIRRAEGRELMQSLAVAPGDDGGVLLTNIGVPWLSHAVLSHHRADMITCTIEGNPDGSTAVDYTVNCATGFPAMTGGASKDAPVNHVLPAWDIACAYQAAFGVSAAVANRQAIGQGAELRLALSDVAFSMLSHLGMLAEAELLQQERPSLGNYLYGAFGKDFGTADGSRVFVAAISLGQWSSLVRACDLAGTCAHIESDRGLDLKKEGDRYSAREMIAEHVGSWCASRGIEQVRNIFQAHKVCWGVYQTVQDAFVGDPRLSEANPVFERVSTIGVGTHLAAGGTLRVSGLQRHATVAAPLLGQHTDQILLEVLGLNEGAVGRLHDAGIVAGPDSDPLMQRA
ncbi:CoA transferase [Variovorax ginsengisoli]|uniref:CoA transferase n=1 Tax=Variovorax ginsengisoli TaxID=363844 RepID=A0ABT8S9Y3_9BURK|nr:CoA transferase [Variovorax ginsengisoli]MDN8615647.1 CoA transferase [Variovorax ginsengisoli]MDO1534817.1 CoA transferase [Variovorax ginsengisoli]